MVRKSPETPKTFNFTVRALEELQPPTTGKQAYYNDSKVRGLEISVTAAGTKQFFYRRKIEGESRRMKLGYFPDLKIERARARAQELRAMIAVGENPFDKLQASRAELTLEGLFNEYLNRHAVAKRKTAAVMPKEFALRVQDLKDKKVSLITPYHAAKLHSDLTKERGPYAANRAVQLLRAVYNFGIRTKLVTVDNPFTGITLNPEQARDRFLSNEEAARLLKVLDKLTGDDARTVRDFVYIALFTGARKSNIFEMQWSQIDETVCTWTIPDTKNSTRQVVALGDTEMDLLKDRKKFLARESKREGKFPSIYVFPGTGATGHMTDIKRSWHTVRKAAGLQDVTIHDLRRSLAAGLANSNVNIALIKGVMNHKDIKTTTKHYAHTGKDAERDAKDVVYQRWAEAAKQAEKDAKKVVPIDSGKNKGGGK